MSNRFVYAGTVALFLLLYTLTEASTVGDALVYVDDVLGYQQGKSTERLWEFGHVLWRPLGWVTWHATRPVTSGFVGSDPRAEIMVGFVALNLAAMLGIAITAAAICRLLGASARRTWAGVAIVLSMNAFLNWGQAGTSYAFGFFFQLLAVYWAMRCAVGPHQETHRGWLAAGTGLALGFATLVWFPYVLTAPAVLMLMFTFNADASRFSLSNWRTRLQPALVAGTTAAVIVIAVYGAIALAHQIATPSAFLAWVRSSSHGMDQNRRLLRLVMGLPRGFFYLGNDGTIVKRMLFHDPYAPVSAFDVIRLSLWKLPVFYLGLLTLLAAVYRSRERWGILLPLCAGSLIMLFFAVVLFEPGSVERFLPATALLVPALAIAVRDFHFRRHTDKLALAAACLMILVNLQAYAISPNPARTPAALRIAAVHEKLKPNSRVVLLSTIDDIAAFHARYPTHEFTRVHRLPSYHLIEPGIRTEGGVFNAFARMALDTWQRGGDLWISRRLTIPRPLPDWGWVEGDNPSLPWKDISGYFGSFETAGSTGGEDGFVLIPASEANKALLERIPGKDQKMGSFIRIAPSPVRNRMTEMPAPVVPSERKG